MLRVAPFNNHFMLINSTHQYSAGQVTMSSAGSPAQRRDVNINSYIHHRTRTLIDLSVDMVANQ